MGRCGVLGCHMKTNKKRPKITLHRFPTCKKRKEQWLDLLGIENLNNTTKHIFICSLHFEDKCFNRTLNVTRLRDDALPSRELLVPAQFDENEEQQSGSCRVLEKKPVCSTSNYSDLPTQLNECEEQQFVSHKALEEKPICSTSSCSDLPAPFNECEEQKFVSHKRLEEEPVCSTSSYADDKALEIIQKLKSKCENQKKKIKRLNEKVRRQSKKIADFKTVMKDLRDKKYVNVFVCM